MPIEYGCLTVDRRQASAGRQEPADQTSSRLSERQLDRLIEVGPWLISELDLEMVLNRLLDTAREVTGARYAALGVLESHRAELERFLTLGLTSEQEEVIGARPRGSGILGLLISDPHPLRLVDLTSHSDAIGFPVGHPPMRSFLGVPVLIRGVAWGNLYLTDKRDGEFTQPDEDAVVTLAAWAAIAIEHARLLAAAGHRQDQLERALGGLEAVQAIAVAVGAETALDRVLELIAKRGRAIVEARTVLIMLQDGDDLVVAARAGYGDYQAGVRVPVADSTSGQVMVSQQPARFTDVAALRVPATALGVADAHSALLVPLLYRGRALGVLAAFDRGEALVFSEEDEQLLVAFAASAATAVATAQSVQAERLRHSLNAAEAERKRFARELHDETLQTLGGLKLLSSAAQRMSDPDQMRQALDALAVGLEGAIDNLHGIISELRPAALDDLGLRPAIETLAEHHRVVNGLDVSYTLDLPNPAQSDRRLALELETTVYRLIQEALTNVAKHANAKHVEVLVDVGDGQVRIEVVDDGVGFEPGGMTVGFGLTSMRERAALADGSVSITSRPGETRVMAMIPSGYAD
jgi:signal transduction histidine kinase